jgi:hypothetical protein
MQENDKICDNFIAILKNEDIQKYGGDAIWDLVQAVFTGDIFSGISTIKNTKDMLFHIPTAIFWDKMQRFLLGTYRNFEEQSKMAAKFSDDNEKNREYVYMFMETVDKLDSKQKINYFSNLARVFLLNIIDADLFYKLRQILLNCTYNELAFIEKNNSEKHFEYDIMISSLKNIGLLEQETKDDRTYYVFTDLAKSLKIYALSGDNVLKPAVKYLELSAPTDLTMTTTADIDGLFDDATIQCKLKED